MTPSPASSKRTRFVRPYPNFTLEDTLALPRAIQDSISGLPLDRPLLARALGTTTSSSSFTMKINSSAKYGLTQGGYNDPQISLTPLGKSIVAPEDPDELRRSLIEAALHPDVFGRFYKMLDGKRLPEGPYAQNMLQRELSIHPALTLECLAILKANGLFVGVLREVGDSLSVVMTAPEQLDDPDRSELSGAEEEPPPSESESAAQMAQADDAPKSAPHRRLFIGHGGLTEPVGFVRALLEDFGLAYGIVEGETRDEQPVPEEISDEMRRCTAAVLVFDSLAGKGTSSRPNPLGGLRYMLGAASVLYGGGVVIFAERRFASAEWPAGVERVIFDADQLEAAGLELLKALNRVGAVRVSP